VLSLEVQRAYRGSLLATGKKGKNAASPSPRAPSAQPHRSPSLPSACVRSRTNGAAVRNTPDDSPSSPSSNRPGRTSPGDGCCERSQRSCLDQGARADGGGRGQCPLPGSSADDVGNRLACGRKDRGARGPGAKVTGPQVLVLADRTAMQLLCAFREFTILKTIL